MKGEMVTTRTKAKSEKINMRKQYGNQSDQEKTLHFTWTDTTLAKAI